MNIDDLKYNKLIEMGEEAKGFADLFSDDTKSCMDKLNHYLEIWIKSSYENKFHTNIIDYRLLESFSIENYIIEGYTYKSLYYGHELIGVFMYKWDFDNIGHIVLKYTYAHP